MVEEMLSLYEFPYMTAITFKVTEFVLSANFGKAPAIMRVTYRTNPKRFNFGSNLFQVSCFLVKFAWTLLRFYLILTPCNPL